MAKTNTMSGEKQNFVQMMGYFIVYLMTGVVPHIYRYMTFVPSENEGIYFKKPMYADLYMLAKSQVFLLLSVMLLCIFLYQLSSKQIKFKKDKLTIVTAVFGLSIVLSSAFSVYKDIVYWGAKDRFEGMFVWLAYLVIFTIIRHYSVDKTFVKKNQKIFVFSASIMAIFGLMQVFGYDIYTAGPLKWLAFPQDIAKDMASYMTANVTEAGAVGALFNSNYFGVYSAFATIMALYYAFTEEKKSVLYFILALLQYGAMIASKSEAALLGFAVALSLFVSVYGKEIINRKQYALLALLLAVGMDRYLAMNLLYGQSGNALWIYLLMLGGLAAGFGLYLLLDKQEQLKVLVSKKSMVMGLIAVILMVAVINVGVAVTGRMGNKQVLQSLSFNQNVIMVEHQNQSIMAVECLANGVNVYDAALTPLKPEVSGNNLSYVLKDVTYNLTFKNYSNGYLLTFNEPFSMNIFFDGTSLQYVNPSSGVGMIEAPAGNEFYFTHGTAFTNRAYIWSRYLPIAQQYIALGKGLDTYLIGFPQNDYFGKTAFYNEGDNLLVDKPHSLYIDLFYGVGIVGLVVSLLFAVYVGRQYFYGLSLERHDNGYMIALLGTILMLVAGIFNDSTIPLTLLLSCFGGMGLMINGEES